MNCDTLQGHHEPPRRATLSTGWYNIPPRGSPSPPPLPLGAREGFRKTAKRSEPYADRGVPFRDTLPKGVTIRYTPRASPLVSPGARAIGWKTSEVSHDTLQHQTHSANSQK